MIAVLVFLMLELQFKGTQGGVSFGYLALRDGDEATLPCWNKCNGTSWSFSGSNTLFNDWQKKKATSDRVSLNANCNLVIHKVTAEDAGDYYCRVPSNRRGTPGTIHQISLSVVVLTQQKYGDRVNLHCSALHPKNCEQNEVKWLHNSKKINSNHPYIKTSKSWCSAIVTILNFTYSNISSYDFTCSVKLPTGVQIFAVNPHSLDEETNASSENNTNAVSEQPNGDSVTLSSSVSPPDECEQEKMEWIHKSTAWCRFIIVAVVLAALITAVVMVNIWTKAREKTQRDENMVFNEEDGGAVKNKSVQSSDEV